MKIAKLSLVAAVAVAGLSTANAQPLEEAIKNVEVSGSVVYRYNDYNSDAKNDLFENNNSSTNNNYKVGLNLSSKVNEDVKFNSRFLAANSDGNFAGALDTQAGADSNVDVTLSNAYFGYTGIANTTVNVGKQGLTTPWTTAVDSDGNEQTGTGILALSTVGPVTLAGAFFNQTNLNNSTDAAVSGINIGTSTTKKVGNNTVNKTNDEFMTDVFSGTTSVKSVLNGASDVVTVGAIANLNPVTLDAWYLNLADTFNTYTVGAKSDLDLSGVKFGIDARYAYLKFDQEVADAMTTLLNNVDADGEIDRQNAMMKLALTAKAGIVSGKLAYANTDKKGGLTALDNDANTTLLGWNLTSNGKFDADYWQAVVAVDVLSNLNLSANYGSLDHKSHNSSDAVKIEEEEIYAQLTYKMSKNLSSYVRYGVYDKDIKDGSDKYEINDDLRGRVQVEYTF